MSEDSKHLEMTLETQVESVNLAEEMCLRVAEAAGLAKMTATASECRARRRYQRFSLRQRRAPRKKITLLWTSRPTK